MENTLSKINEAVMNSPVDFIAQCENEYITQIKTLAKQIADDDDIVIAAIAGPSASGKTTTAHLLCRELELAGETTAVVSLDDFYLPQDKLPVLPDGKLDLETVNSLDIPLIRQCFNEIVESGKTLLPTYDFIADARTAFARQVDVGSKGIVIVEGLHALNPVITNLVPRKNIFKIYISVNTPIVDEDGEKVLSSRQVRLIRRALRDETFRGSPISETLTFWTDVVNNEDKYLYCFKDEADFQLVTLHSYELGLYKERFCGMASSVNESVPNSDYFFRTVNGLLRFNLLEKSLVPKNSLIREFIGQDE